MSDTEILKKIIKEAVKEEVEASHLAVSQTVSSFGNEVKKLNGIGKIPKFFKTDFGFLIAVLGFLVSVLTPYYLIKTDVAIIFEKINYTNENIKGVADELSKIDEAHHRLVERVSKIEGSLTKNAKVDDRANAN